MSETNHTDLDREVEVNEPQADNPQQDAEPASEAPSELDLLKAEMAELQDRYLRQAAEFQNYRRRSEQERLLQVELGKSVVLQEVLDILDDFERTREAVQKMDVPTEDAIMGMKEGIELVHRKFTESLTRLGVRPIDAVGKPFHEDEHEALLRQPAPEGTEAGTILVEFQKGYRLGDRVLRHSRVVVAS